MYQIDDPRLWDYIKSDLPSIDLTNELLQIDKIGSLEIVCREEAILCATEEASRIAQLLQCQTKFFLPSRTPVQAETVVIRIEGSFANLHKAWRLIQGLLEYSSGMATYTAAMVSQIHTTNPDCQLLTTRKSFPFAKEICIKSIMCGGAYPHRLGLSESILLFGHHKKGFSHKEDFLAAVTRMQRLSVEKKVIIESGNYQEAIDLIDRQVDGVQLERFSFPELEKIVQFRNHRSARTVLLATGGIHRDNAGQFAATGVDAIVSGAPYHKSGVTDMGSRLEIFP